MAITKLTEKTIEENPSASTHFVITHPVPVEGGGTKESVERLTAEDVTDLVKELGDIPELDDTLAVSGAAADSKAVGDEIADLKSALSGKPEIKDSLKTGVDLDVSDPNGNILVRFRDGHIETAKFNSADYNTEIILILQLKRTAQAISQH